MQLFYAPDINPPLHTLSGEESRHAVKVLRLGIGDRLHLTDGQGNLYEAEVTRPDPRGCEVRVVETFSDYGRRPYSLTMAVAPTKNSDRYEWFLEKATEVGIDRIVPIGCANSERQCEPHGQIFKSERAQRLMVSAMKQSLKACLPLLEPMTPVREVLERPFDGGAGRTGVKLIAHCRPESEFAPRVPIVRALPAYTDALILIGPEGDFTAEEIALAIANGFIPVSLGESRLRTETAALAAVIAAYIKNS